MITGAAAIARRELASRPMRVRPITCAVLAALLGLLAAACGSSKSNGIAAKSPNQILAQATRAIDNLHSVRVTGTVSGGSATNTIKLDLKLVSGKGATGTMSESGLSLRLVSVGGRAYVNGSPAFLKQFAGARAAAMLDGKWISAPADRGKLSSFSSLTDLHKLLAGVIGSHGALTKGATTTVRGQQVIAVRDAGKGGTLYVATTGKPYPIRIDVGGADGGQLDFSDFNRPVTLAAPAHSIDINTLQK